MAAQKTNKASCFERETLPGLGRFLPDHDGQVVLVENIHRDFEHLPHVDPALIEADRENLKDSVFAIKHDARFLYDAGDSMISLEHVRAVIDKPPAIVHGKTSAFCDFAGAGDESVLGSSAKATIRGLSTLGVTATQCTVLASSSPGSVNSGLKDGRSAVTKGT